MKEKIYLKSRVKWTWFFTFLINYLCRKLFPDIMRAAYLYIQRKFRDYLKTTGMPPYFSIAVDKSTPLRDTNHAIMLIVPLNGIRKAIPLDAAIVYELNDNGELSAGSGSDLADQIVNVLSEKLKFDEDDFSYIRSNYEYLYYSIHIFLWHYLGRLALFLLQLLLFYTHLFLHSFVLVYVFYLFSMVFTLWMCPHYLSCCI